jgi:hypothetical protein
MNIYRITIVICLLSLSFVSFSQKSLVVGKDTINRLDAKSLKQGKWVFYDVNQHPQVMCSFKNDTIVGNRIFMIDSGKVLVREPIKEGKEHFLYLRKGEKIRGWFDLKGKAFYENPSDSLKNDSVVFYLIGVPAVYMFGQKNLGEEIEETLKPIKNQLKANKLVVEFLINRGGMTEMIDVKLAKPNEKLEQKIRSSLEKFDRWQPAFNGWRTEPYKKQVVINY